MYIKVVTLISDLLIWLYQNIFIFREIRRTENNACRSFAHNWSLL